MADFFKLNNLYSIKALGFDGHADLGLSNITFLIVIAVGGQIAEKVRSKSKTFKKTSYLLSNS
jgi:hypothetical protein